VQLPPSLPPLRFLRRTHPWRRRRSSPPRVAPSTTPPPRRSRSVSAAPHVRGVVDDYTNTRTNPLFDSMASPSTSSSPPAAGMWPGRSRTEGVSRSRLGDGAAAVERGRCLSRRKGAAPVSLRRRTVLPLSAGGDLLGLGR
jgi:hypothetical protein